MSAKRALVVDDSKSARAFLARILERHEIAVDAAESAEAAIEYLARHKPDIIFMDHMMPGMDGFQAVQTIKNNPRTSAIPILMYTSQEGDLYAGQARALGAAGVLPKQIKQADVTRMLYQLRLVADRRGEDQTTFRHMATGMGNDAEMPPANESAIVVTVPEAPPQETAIATAPGEGEGVEISKLLPRMSLEIRAALDGSLQKELVALRSFIAASLDTHSERIEGQIVAAMPPPAPALEMPTLLPERRPWPAMVAWSLAVVALAGAASLSWLWWQQGSELAALRADLDAAYAEVETLRARPAVVSTTPPVADAPAGEAVLPAPDAPDATAAATPDVTLVPADGSPVNAVSPPAAVESAPQPSAASTAPAPVPAATPLAPAAASSPISQAQ